MRSCGKTIPEVTRTARIVLTLLALAAGCGGGGTGGQSVVEQAAATPDDEDASDITINVVSRAFADATIYLHVGASRRRLGTAQGKSTTKFTVSWNKIARTGQIQLRADPIGDEADLITDLVSIQAGSQVVWTLEVHGHSGVDVY